MELQKIVFLIFTINIVGSFCLLIIPKTDIFILTVLLFVSNILLFVMYGIKLSKIEYEEKINEQDSA